MHIAILGWMGSGKDTVAKYIESRNDFVKDSFAATLKDVCSTLFSWPRHLLEGDSIESREWRETVDTWWSEKLKIDNFTPRWALQNVGTEVFRDGFNGDIWLLTFLKRLETVHAGKNVVISDCRFRNEIDFFKRIGGKLIFVDNGIRPEWYDTALAAISGDESSEFEMLTKYNHVHRSEWDWLGTVPDVVIDNNFDSKNQQTYAQLKVRIDQALINLDKDFI